MLKSGCLILFVLFQCQSLKAIPARPGQTDQNPYTLSVGVNLVLLPVAVTDRSGAAVPGLAVTDFKVYEDGIQQEILQFDHEDIPVAMGLVLDSSSSMTPKMREVVTAALALVKASNRRDQMFVIHFSEDAELGLPAELPFTSDIDKLREAVVRSALRGRTALYDAIALGLNHLKQTNLQKRILVVLTDGGDNASRLTLPETLQLAIDSNALLYTIGLFDEANRDRNPRILRRIARDTGGECFLPSDPRALPHLCERIASDIRTQYTLGYVSSDHRKDGRYRAVQVVVDSPRHRQLTVRTRPGYVAPRDPSADLIPHDSPGDKP